MDFRFSSEDATLQREAVEFVQQEWDPKGHDIEGNGLMGWDRGRGPGRGEEADLLTQEFAKKLAAKGWWTMHWPKEFGGGGVSITTQLAYREAMAYAGAPAAAGGGLTANPIMLAGQEWQKQEFLPKLASAEYMDFAQGFSEPNAGSDLANLQMRGVRDGDDYVINGQKIWGSYRFPWMHMLMRTDPDAPKHRGITSILMQLRNENGDYLPGVTVRPILDGLGRHRWDELFLEDVRVPTRNIMGEENRGWYVAMTSLNFERSNIQGPAGLIRLIEQFVHFYKSTRRTWGENPLNDPRIRHQLADCRLEVEAARMLSYRVGWMQSQGLVPDKEASMTKVWGDALTQRVYRFLSRILGEYGNLLPGNKISIPVLGYLNSRAWLSVGVSIAGGATEIQRNIIAQRGLGLPR